MSTDRPNRPRAYVIRVLGLSLAMLASGCGSSTNTAPSGPGGTATAAGGVAAQGGSATSAASALQGGTSVLGGTTVLGGAPTQGGIIVIGGVPSQGGTSAPGGTGVAGGGPAASGGAPAQGGSTVIGGNTAPGGTTVAGGSTTASGGAPAQGGSTVIGGNTALGGTGVAGGGPAASGGAPAQGGSTAIGGNTAPGGTTVAGGSITASGGAPALGGTGAQGGTTVVAGGATASGGAAVQGGTTTNGGVTAQGGTSTGGTGGMASDPSICTPATGGAALVHCGAPGTSCQVSTTYTDFTTYCADDSTCKACTNSGQCSTADCRDCCSGFSSNGSCIASCTGPGHNCLGGDCKDCCLGRSSQGRCVECNRHSDCPCPGLCNENHECTCTPTTPAPRTCAKPESNCFDCCGTYFHGDHICGCTPAGGQCSRTDCYDCCNHVALVPQNVCSCTPAGNACVISGCADCCEGHTSFGRCIGTVEGVTFAGGKAVGAMNGYGWVALGSSDFIADPTCGGTAITNANPCASSTTWNSTAALCMTGSVPALGPTPDYTSNWGVSVGVNAANPSGGGLGQTFASIAITVTGAPTSGLLAVVHRSGDPAGITYCAALTSGAAISLTSFKTNCSDSPPGGTYLTAADVPSIDQIAVQVSSTASAITVTNLCITGIAFVR